MKKYIITLLALTMMFSMTACDSEEKSDETSFVKSETQVSQISENQMIQTSEETVISEAVSETVVQQVQAEVQTESSENGNGVTELTYIDGILIANKTYALPSDYDPGVDPEAMAAFEEMQKAAYSAGCNIYISSGYRSYERQNEIYNRYVARDGQAAADTYSARPGHSEHQTGLAFDLNTIDSSFANTAEGKWVAQNCHKYGFIIRYTKEKEAVTGYMYEPWHIRYLGVETATAVYESGLCLEEYLGITSSYDDFEKIKQ